MNRRLTGYLLQQTITGAISLLISCCIPIFALLLIIESGISRSDKEDAQERYYYVRRG